ncbi:VOC family protein [Shewanella sp. JM162201]|uniref:VOC family protein n=1 Tax=Shewanella jiangmenensis TaxID=2837387 RepID=A0ABS5UZH6_9GAMM|nr:VOC family protein [Shewanella jiangmenensis]MBT1443601.1 VOC family protein [Shewanella jiangmenensis]
MVHLEHINLVVHDLQKSLKFYQAAFPHWKVRGGGQGSWYGKPRRWLHFGDEYQYIALNNDGEGAARDLKGHQPGLAHFAFVVASLDGLIQRMADAGFAVDKDGAPDLGRRNVYFIDPDGMEVEFVQYLSDEPAVRNQYPA